MCLTDVRVEQRLTRLGRYHRTATAAHIAVKVNAGCDRKMSEQTSQLAVYKAS